MYWKILYNMFCKYTTVLFPDYRSLEAESEPGAKGQLRRLDKV